MTMLAFGTRRRRNEGRWLLAGLLMATTAMVMIPEARAAGSIVDTTAPGHPAYHYDIGALSAGGRIFVANRYDPDAANWSVVHVTPDAATVFPYPSFYSYARAMSGDGRYVVGAYQSASGNRAFRWEPLTGEILDLGLLYPAIPSATASGWDISGDGTRVVGAYQRPGMTRAFAWIENATTGMLDNEQMYQLQGLNSASAWSALAISDDGNFAAGESNGNATTGLAVRWDLRGLEAGGVGADVVLNLGSFTGVDSGTSAAYDISADGRVVVGRAASADGRGLAFRWVEGATDGVADNRQMYELGSLFAGYLGESGSANAVSRDGRYIVGGSGWDAGSLAFRWSEETGMESVHDWMARNGVAVGDFDLQSASAVSDDGRVIGGSMQSNFETRAYIARVTDPTEPGGEPGPGSGLMDVAEYQQTLYSAAGGIASAGEFLTWLPMNGAHHRPLMLAPSLSGDSCLWATGDFAHHNGSSTGLGLAEIGACTDLAGGSVRLGGAVGTTRSWQDLAMGGSNRLAGQYILGEADWQPDGTPLLLSVTGMLGGWQANVDRAYSNGAATAVSRGSTTALGGVIRLRADWLEAATLGNTTINPWTALSLGALHVDGYKESGGPFPAQFDAQSLSHVDMRLGLTAITELSAQTRLSTTFEVAHRTGTAAKASGQVDGVFDFSLGGGHQAQTWIRVGAEIDHKITEHLSLSASAHLASAGRDPSIAASVGIKGAF